MYYLRTISLDHKRTRIQRCLYTWFSFVILSNNKKRGWVGHKLSGLKAAYWYQFWAKKVTFMKKAWKYVYVSLGLNVICLAMALSDWILKFLGMQCRWYWFKQINAYFGTWRHLHWRAIVHLFCAETDLPINQWLSHRESSNKVKIQPVIFTYFNEL